jgi:hypothetical protein
VSRTQELCIPYRVRRKTTVRRWIARPVRQLPESRTRMQQMPQIEDPRLHPACDQYRVHRPATIIGTTPATRTKRHQPHPLCAVFRPHRPMTTIPCHLTGIRIADRVRQTSLCEVQVPMSRDRRVQLHLHIRTRPARAPHHGRARRLKVEVLHEAMAGLRNPVLRRRVPRLLAMAVLKAAQLPRATAQQLHLRLQLLKEAKTNKRDETENAASRGGVSFSADC